jgi:hypothetical protein
VNGAGSYGWGGADGTQFVVDRSKRTFTLFMVQTQHYKAPTYPVFLALASEACGLPAPAMPMTGMPGKPGAGGAGGPFQQRDTNQDGKLSRDELPAALFDKLDANKDGSVTEAELTALWKQK